MEQFYGNKIAWVTGASSGIGEALVKALAACGAVVVLSARREDELLRVKKEAGLSDENSFILPIDLYHSDEITSAANKVKERFGKIDILFCSAGIVERFSVAESTMELNRQIMELNFFSVIALTKCVLPGMIEQKSGNIVVISSVVGKVSLPRRSIYAASKHALHGFFDALRAEVYRDNIKVTVICPGYVKTNISMNALDASGKKHGKMDKGQEHGMPPEKCAKAILKAVEKGKDEAFVGGKEIYVILLKRFFPGLVNYLMKQRRFS